MNKILLIIGAFMVISSNMTAHEKGDKIITPVPFTNVHFTDSFWKQRIDTLRLKTIPYAFKRSEEAGYIDNFAIAGGLKTGKYQSDYPFDDAEVYKIIEGAAYLLAVERDPKLEAYVDSVISIIVAAQEPDGYLFTNRTINNPLHPWVSKERWELDWNLSHETFNAGELYEAAVAYYYATGKRTLLDAAIKNADLICDTFHEDGLVIAPGHQVIEMALVRLYEATGNERYLKQSRFFLETRGRRKFDTTSDDLRKNGKYWQDHLPVRHQDEAVGHAVRALYLYSGMADIAMHMHDTEYLNAINTIWDNIVTKKFYITGGLGARAQNEAFGVNYELPNATGYNETCASIANSMFNLRMFRLHGQSKYIDVLERSLYNTVLSGISLSGDSYFYPNVLEADKKGQVRSFWFDCTCCPTNLARFIPAVSGYVYATDEQSIYTNLFASNTAEIDFNGKKILLEQETNYPWDEDIRMTINSLETNKFDLKIRIPGWMNDEVVPSDLYSYVDKPKSKLTVKINGKAHHYDVQDGYAVLKRDWKKGDLISIHIPMEVHQVVTHKTVTTNKNLVAVERGPLVYCAEFADNGGSVFNLSLPLGTDFKVNKSTNILNNPYIIEGKGLKYSILDDGQSIKEESTTINFIPYYARAHRGAGEMKVWLPINGDKIQQELHEQTKVIDEVIIGNVESEKAHNLQGKNSRSDQSGGWRDADNGWFSYDMAIDASKKMELVLTYHSTDGGNRSFEIWIDDTKIADHSLRTETFDLFLDHSYPLSEKLVKGKSKITVKLQALPNNFAGGIFGCKIRMVD